MQIKHIQLQNFRQHKKLDIPIKGNLIGIVGPNGSGKSNLLNAVQFGLTGEVPDVVKSKLLTWGEKSGHVQLELAESGDILNRSVSGNGAELITRNQKFTGINPVNKVLEDLYGVNKEIARQTVFVRQAEIDAVLFETPARREQSFQKLCGMAMASKIHKEIGEFIYDRLKDRPSYMIQIEAVREALVDSENRLVALEQEQKEAMTPMPNDKLLELKLELREIRAKLNKLAQATTLVVERDTVKQAYDTANEELDKVSTRNELEMNLDSIDEAIEGAKQLERDAQMYLTVKADYEKRNMEVNSLEQPPVTEQELQALEEEYTRVQGAYQKAMGHYNSLQGIYNAIFAMGTINKCPICDSDIADPTKVQTDLKAKLDQYAATKDGAELAGTIRNQKSALSTYQLTKARTQTLYDQAKAAYEAATPIEVDPTILRTEIVKMESIRTEVAKVQKEKEALETRKQVHHEALTSYDQRIETLMTELGTAVATLHTSIETYTVRAEELEQEIEKDTAIAQEYNRIMAGKVELEKSLENLTSSLKDLEAKQAGMEHYEQVYTTIHNVREWFHYTKGPRTLSANILGDMTANVNDFLQKLEAPFTITPQQEAGLAFACTFHDGRLTDPETPPVAEDLSGGEKILLATSFRLASYCMFANQLGLLSLDEPTVYLDDRNVARFCAFLGKLKEVASTLGLQIFMATHERSVIPYMDTVIDLQ